MSQANRSTNQTLRLGPACVDSLSHDAPHLSQNLSHEDERNAANIQTRFAGKRVIKLVTTPTHVTTPTRVTTPTLLAV